jgi:hypothetical protein
VFVVVFYRLPKDTPREVRVPDFKRCRFCLLAVLLVASAGLITGCYITSVHALADTKDRQFDPAVIGTWISGHDTLEIAGDAADNLEFIIKEGPGAFSDSSRSGTLDLLLTSIGGMKYMDIRPSDVITQRSPILEQMLLVPMHSFMHYRVDADTLSMQYLNYTEFNKLFESGKLERVQGEKVAESGPILLTSTTSSLRKFFDKHGKDEGLFADPMTYVRLK